jgi:hypothetical protein
MFFREGGFNTALSFFYLSAVTGLPMICPKYGLTMRVIAVIIDPFEVKKYQGYGMPVHIFSNALETSYFLYS